MFTDQGLRTFLTALGTVGYGVRFIAGGARYGKIYPVDAGYPKLGDTDEANDSKGTNVLTWRITVPKGAGWGSTPATEAELVNASGEIQYKVAIPSFRVSEARPSVLYLNLNLRKTA